jgi:hypothetical protein
LSKIIIRLGNKVLEDTLWVCSKKVRPAKYKYREMLKD